METITVSRAAPLTLNLVFTDSAGAAINISTKTLFFTAASKVDSSDTDAEIKKKVILPTDADTIVGKYALSLTPTDMTVAEGTYYCNYRLWTTDLNYSDSTAFLLKIEQRPTTRIA